jgi:hypothetical protein
MLRTSSTTGLLISGGAAVTLLLAGCGQQAQAATQPPQSPSGAVAAGDSECKVGDLSLSVSEPEGAAGTFYRYLVFTDKGGRACTIAGFPGVSYVTGDDGRQVGEAAFRDGPKQPAVTLQPGDKAFVTVGFKNVDNFDEATCKPTATRGLRVYPPHEYDSMFVPLEGTGCAGTPQGAHQLTVTSIAPGTGS